MSTPPNSRQAFLGGGGGDGDGLVGCRPGAKCVHDHRELAESPRHEELGGTRDFSTHPRAEGGDSEQVDYKYNGVDRMQIHLKLTSQIGERVGSGLLLLQ